MSYEKLTYLQKERINKPLIEDYIVKFLDGDKMKNALNFNIYMSENKTPLRKESRLHTWSRIYKGKPVCEVFIGGDVPGLFPGNWRIRLRLNNMEAYEDYIINAGWQDYFWGKVEYCKHSEKSPLFGTNFTDCKPSKGCFMGNNTVVLGKLFENYCAACNLGDFWNPDETVINDMIKKLLNLEIKARDNK